MSRRMEDKNSKSKSEWIPTKAVYVQTLTYFNPNIDSWEVKSSSSLIWSDSTDVSFLSITYTEGK